jgi:hypothetical protein
MTSSGLYNYDPSAFDLLTNAFARIGMRRTQLTAEHYADAATEANLLQVQVSNLQPDWWLNELYEVELDEGIATYVLPKRMVTYVAMYIGTDQGGGTVIDRILGPISAYEYAAQPNKETQGIVTSFWFDRKITPQVTLWPVPDGNGPYTLKVRMLTQPQDAVLPSGVTPDFPYRFLDAFTAGLAHRLARIYAPDKEAARKMDAQEAWNIAANQDTGQEPLYIIPGLSSYYS